RGAHAARRPPGPHPARTAPIAPPRRDETLPARGEIRNPVRDAVEDIRPVERLGRGMRGREFERHAATPEEHQAEPALRERAVEGEPEPHPVAPQTDRAVAVRRAHDYVIDRDAGRRRRTCLRQSDDDGKTVKPVAQRRIAGEADRPQSRLARDDVDRPALEQAATPAVLKGLRLDAEKTRVGGPRGADVRRTDLDAPEFHASVYHSAPALAHRRPGWDGSDVFSFALSDEERLVQETARRFAHDRLLPQLRVH